MSHTRLVQFTQAVDPDDKDEPLNFLINPDHVACIVPFETHTAMLVQGEWFKIACAPQDAFYKLWPSPQIISD